MAGMHPASRPPFSDAVHPDDAMHQPPVHQSLSDLYLTLSHAFRVPEAPATFAAMRAYLADDLAGIQEDLPFRFDQKDLSDLADALARTPDHLTLLQLYSALFLVPPKQVPLFAGIYLDGGTILGRSVDAMRDAYRRHGVDFAMGGGDLPDHLAVQLEFMALLHGRAATAEGAGREELAAEADSFRDIYLRPWIRSLAMKMEEADITAIGTANPYAVLALIVLTTVWGGQVPSHEARAEVKSERTAVAKPEDQQVCRVCGESYVQSVDIRNMRKILAKKGIDGDFLNACPACRTTEMGAVALIPPELRRHTWTHGDAV